MNNKSVFMMSWNVNGIRAILKKNFMEFVNTFDPDILCLQETRAERDAVDLDLPQYEVFWNSSIVKKGYSGTAIFTKHKPLSSTFGIGSEEHDQEGRVVTLEFNGFYLVNVYTPNSGDKLKRLEYRTSHWDIAFLEYVKSLESKKPVIFCGDLNVAHKEIDLARPEGNEKSAGFTIEERERFDAIEEAGFIDSFREFNQEGENYSWWSYRTRARARNIGWRIDYFCLSKSLRPELLEAAIHNDVLGSDHCPVSIKVDQKLI